MLGFRYHLCTRSTISSHAFDASDRLLANAGGIDAITKT